MKHASTKSAAVLFVLSFTVIILAWEVMARWGGWSALVFPGPAIVLKGFFELAADGVLFNHAVASLYRVTVGFYLAALLGIPLGIFVGRHKTARLLIDPVIQFLRPISPLAWIPLAMLWLGIGDPPAIFLIFLSSFFPLMVATIIAVESVNPVYFQVAAIFRYTRFERLTKVIIPAIVPELITAVRLAMAVAWLVVVAAEMIAVQSGLGYLILDSRNALRMDYVMVGMITIGLIGLALDLMMQQLGKFEGICWKKAAG